MDSVLSLIQSSIPAQAVVAFGVLGALAVFRFALGVLSFVWRHFLRAGKDLGLQYGSWAIVTGATDGIGRAYADELAKQGLNLVLISRTQSKLDVTAKEIADAFDVECISLAIDFSSFGTDSGAHAKVTQAISGLDIGVLINNVGQSYPHPEYYHDIPEDLIDSLDSINMASVTWMTRIVLPGMIEKGRGAVVNISSIAGVLPSPLLTQYSASKAFVVYHTLSLATEYKSHGIDFQVQTPLFVTTKLAKIRKSSITTPTPETFAKAAVAQIGYEYQSQPYWMHDFITCTLQMLPQWLVQSQTLSMHKGLQKRAHKKAAAKRA